LCRQPGNAALDRIGIGADHLHQGEQGPTRHHDLTVRMFHVTTFEAAECR
jgi:hypothetical protein